LCCGSRFGGIAAEEIGNVEKVESLGGVEEGV
jgi:hypothetical protein